MGQEVTGNPTFPKHHQTVTFNKKRFKITFVWRDRTKSWYFDMFSADGTALVRGRRLSPKWPPTASIGFAVGAAPDGNLFVRGVANYKRDDLGATLVLVRYDDSETPATATATGTTVTGGT